MFGANVKTGCKDCGHRIYHPPIHNGFGTNMAKKFENVHVIILYDYTSKHYLTLIKGQVEKCLMSCALTGDAIQSDKEIGKILAWAEGNQEED